MNKKNVKSMIILGSLLLLVSLVIAACGSNNTNANTNTTNANTNAVEDDQEREELEGNMVRGGLLYDKWWVVTGADEPTEDHPLWDTQDTSTSSGKDTWRCKECHGWDYLGADGAYGSGSHSTGFTGVIGAADMSAEEITAWLNGENNPDHDFASLMDDVYIQALITFLQSEMTDLSGYVNDDKSVDGDRARGQVKYESTCAACHGIDGKKINFHDADDPEYIGSVASSNPWETFHKILHGQPGEPMPSAIGLGWTLDDLIDVLSYIQTLPTE